VILKSLRNVAVLAKGTAKVAAVTPCGKNETAGEKAPKRFLFDWIQCNGGYFPVISANDLILNIGSCTAKSGLPFLQTAMMETDGTSCFH
jgi:hypothetical protein